MAVQCDPVVLANNAICFEQCIPAGDHLPVQTYLLAQIALVTRFIPSADPSTLANLARCFECDIPVGDHLAAQNFLIANSLGITDPTSLPNAASCFSCDVPWGYEMALQTYLLTTLALNLGATNTTDPSKLANAARCWASCIPPGEHLAVQNYLWCQISPVCATPITPTNLVVTSVTKSSVTVAWTQPLGSPAGVTSYLVQWGTSAGNHTLGSATVSGNTPNFTITGLSNLTTFFIVVTAFNGSCSSGVSNEASGETGTCTAGVAQLNNWLGRVATAGGTAPSTDVQSAMVDLYCGLASDGLLPQILSLYVFPPSAVGTVVPNNAGTRIMTHTPFIQGIGSAVGVGVPTVAGEFTVNGVHPTIASSRFLDTGVNLVTSGINMNSVGWFVYMSVDDTNGGCAIGADDINGSLNVFLESAGATMDTIGTGGVNIINIASLNAGFYSGQRVSATNHRLYFAKSTQAHGQIGATDNTVNTATSPNLNIDLWCLNDFGVQDNFCTSTFSAAGITTGMSQSNNKLLFTRLDNFRRAVGGGFV